MPRHHIAFHERSYEMLARAEARRPHEPTPMLSGNSRGPIQTWVCGWAHCNEVRYTYREGSAAPVCEGGFYFSFVTSGAAFDPSVHTTSAAR